MFMTSSAASSDSPSIPAESWRAGLETRLAPGEKILAWLETDLDIDLHFNRTVLAVTDCALYAQAEDKLHWLAWPYAAGDDLKLSHYDHGGVATLELQGAAGRRAFWRYTLGQSGAAQKLIDQFGRQAAMSGMSAAARAQAMRADAAADAEDVGVDAEQRDAPSLHWALFRLVRFAKPYKGTLLIGFLLTLASTAATLVPPYLTMPLMDKVLIPFQNGAPIDMPLVAMYMGGLLGSALVAWSLGWARTYILAVVSERIGADLRTTTYEHLLRLSQQYFGGKRTGDLMTRIGSETDRRADDRHDFLHPDFDQSVAGAGDPAAAAVHRVDDSCCARPLAARLRKGRPHLVSGDQCAGRYDSRHPGGQGLCAGKARSGALPGRQSP
jgi:ATP-binding cassette subfamily B protein